MSTVTRTVVAPENAPAGARAAADSPPMRTAVRVARLSPYAWQMIAITTLGLVGRLVLLGRQPIWRDEAFTALASRRSWLDMLDVVRHDSAPPLSYVASHVATSISATPWALRLPEALAGAAAVPLAGALGRRLGGNRGGLCAAGLVMLSPPFVLASRDARMYALAGTLVLAAALALWRAIERPDRGRLAVLALTVAACLMTEYFTVFAVAAMLPAAALTLRPARATALRCGAALGVALVPLLVWAPFAIPQLQHRGSPFWVRPISGESLLGVLTVFFAGPPVDDGLPHRVLIQWTQGFAIGFGGLAGFLLILHTIFRANSEQRRTRAYLLATGLGALALLLLVSLARSLVEARYASVLWPPLAVLIGVGIAQVRPALLVVPFLGAAALASAMLIALPLRADVTPLVDSIGAPAPHELVLAHQEIYLVALTVASPHVAAATRVAAPSLDWFWGTAVFPNAAYAATIGGDVTRIDELAEPGSASYDRIPPSFRLVEVRAVAGAELRIWERTPAL